MIFKSLRERLQASGVLSSDFITTRFARVAENTENYLILFFNRSRLLMLHRTRTIEEKMQSLRDINIHQYIAPSF